MLASKSDLPSPHCKFRSDLHLDIEHGHRKLTDRPHELLTADEH